MPEMEEVVTRLAKGYPLFLLSNTNALHFEYIQENYPVLKHFSHFILSYKVGSRKPEKGIYATPHPAGRDAAGAHSFYR